MRARNLKPGLFKNDVLAEIEPLGRLLFVGLWCLADREGRLEEKPRRIKAEVLPYDDCNIEYLLQCLAQRGFILRYEVDGAQYIQIPNFLKHQNPHVREVASTIPAPEEYITVQGKHSTSTVLAPEQHNTSPAESPSPFPESPSLIPYSPAPDGEGDITSAEKPKDEPSGGAQGDSSGKGKNEYTGEFEEFWRHYPRKIEKAAAWKNWIARLKEKVSPAELIAASQNYAEYCTGQGTEPQFIKHGETFLGSKKPYEDYIKGVPLEIKDNKPAPAGARTQNKPTFNNFQNRVYDPKALEEMLLEKSRSEFKDS